MVQGLYTNLVYYQFVRNEILWRNRIFLQQLNELFGLKMSYFGLAGSQDLPILYKCETLAEKIVSKPLKRRMGIPRLGGDFVAPGKNKFSRV
jgi:hypothetical protein